MKEQSWTIKDVLDFSTKYLAEHKSSSPRLDSELLLAHVLGLKRLQLYLNFDRPLTNEERVAYRELIRRRGKCEPVAYMTGKKEFWSREFVVGPGVLVPRPETELIIDVVQDISESLFASPPPWRALDVGTGSGILAITLALMYAGLQISAIDISPQALSYASQNIKNWQTEDRITLIQKDFFSFTPETELDLIVSNPPYISHSELATLDSDVKDHEPHEALLADDAGLAFYPRLAKMAVEYLRPGGALLVEIGETQGAQVKNIFSSAGLEVFCVRPDLAGHDRILGARKNG